MKVKVTHFRFITAAGPGNDIRVLLPAGLIKAIGLGRFVDPQGGFTRVRVPLNEAMGIPGEYIEAWSRCSPRDNYSRRLGRTIALNRALAVGDALIQGPGTSAWEKGLRSCTASLGARPENEFGPARTAVYSVENGIAALELPVGVS